MKTQPASESDGKADMAVSISRGRLMTQTDFVPRLHPVPLFVSSRGQDKMTDRAFALVRRRV
jgi:hypothetical protein